MKRKREGEGGGLNRYEFILHRTKISANCSCILNISYALGILIIILKNVAAGVALTRLALKRRFCRFYRVNFHDKMLR